MSYVVKLFVFSFGTKLQKSNPLPEEYQYRGSNQNSNESKKHSRFEERLRAESESFKVVFDKRRQRIGGLDWEEE